MRNWYNFAGVTPLIEENLKSISKKSITMKTFSPLLFLLFVVFSTPLFSQVSTDRKPYDTINQYDANKMKTGYWEERDGEFMTKGYYKNDKRVDNWISFHPNHMIQKIDFYTDGIKNGISIQFDRKGKIATVEYYKNGLLNGTSTTYNQFNESPVSETTYKGGTKNGVARLYYDNGKLQEESYYTNDLKNGTSKWFNKTGKTVASYNYNQGEFEGIQKTFYENDTVQVLSNYTKNKLSGEYKEFYRNGKMKLSGKYTDGLKDGIWIEFDELGVPQRTTKFKLGVQK